MSLVGWTLPQTATGRSVTVPPPPWHYSGDVIAVDFAADPARVAELVPPGFEPRGDGSRLATVVVTLIDTPQGAFPGGGPAPLIHTRLWPSIAREEPAVHELSKVKVTDVEMGTIWRGTAELEIGRSEFDEIDVLVPRTVGAGWVYATAFSAIGGTTMALGNAR